MNVAPGTFRPGYINWLRCASSLGALKESLDEYTDIGVKKLYENVKSNVIIQLNYSYRCTSCSSKDIEKTHKSIWSISCRRCNVWLVQILRKHTHPNSNTINWCNSDITKWSTEPWEIAKIFMPLGQTNKTKQELDIAALLSLLLYCKEFHPIDVTLVTEIIGIRNMVFHSAALSVDDSIKDTWIGKMLALLTHLNIQGNAYSTIEKLRTEHERFPEEQKLIEDAMSEVLNGMKVLKEHAISLENKLQSEDLRRAQSGADREELENRYQQLQTEAQEQRGQAEAYSPVVSRLQNVADNTPGLIESEQLRTAHTEIRALREQIEKNESLIGHLWSCIKDFFWVAVNSVYRFLH